jgi:DNA-binding transcriptional MerR regulator
MKQTYTTSQIAAVFDMHPNTVRLYENWGLIFKPERNQSGYRIFTDEHIKQIEIVKIALKTEVLQNGLRKQAIEIIKTVAERKKEIALDLTKQYQRNIEKEIESAENAIRATKGYLLHNTDTAIQFRRQETADKLNITIDTLRNWELNGLIKVKRKANGYRIYNEKDFNLLLIIRELRVSNYSLSSILRLIKAFENSENVDIEATLNTPDSGEYIISACDKLLISLNKLSKDAKKIEERIKSL